ncbi:hypothetical protein [Leptospira sp. GIMC2001]|uniref:hypothetical protein n=1 Tax=Leptospira sp. GIMC2001 TaxID=1513297 RepID=UPI00234AFBB2|nr:hypothetical protein [Leptospira sp. GIMC2001]WCL50292.1 hypothetical protein O4O04_05580 [Leptospira sp. GIMC2001]
MTPTNSSILEFPDLHLIFQKEASYTNLEPQTRFRGSRSYMMGDRASKVYSDILSKSAMILPKNIGLYTIDESLTEINCRAEIISLISEKLIQQLFYLTFNTSTENLEIQMVLVAGNKPRTTWEVLLRRSLNAISLYSIKHQILDHKKLNRIFCIYHSMDHTSIDHRHFPELPILDNVIGLPHVPIDVMKRDFFNTMKASLDSDSRFIYAEGIGFFFLPDNIITEFIPYLSRKFDSEVMPELKSCLEDWEEDFRHDVKVFFTSKPQVKPNSVSAIDEFVLKASFIDSKKEHLKDEKKLWITNFLVSIAFKLKLFRSKKITTNASRAIDVIKKKIGDGNDIFSRILKIEIDDELLGGDVLDHLYTDPDILHTTWYSKKGLHVLFVKKDVKNVIDLFRILSSSYVGYELAIHLDKVLEDNKKFKNLLVLDSEYRKNRTLALFASFSSQMRWYHKIFYFFKMSNLLEEAVENCRSKIILDQLNLRLLFQEKTTQSTLDKVDTFMKLFQTTTDQAKMDFLKDAKAEAKILYGTHATIEQIHKLLPNFTIDEIKQLIEK